MFLEFVSLNALVPFEMEIVFESGLDNIMSNLGWILITITFHHVRIVW